MDIPKPTYKPYNHLFVSGCRMARHGYKEDCYWYREEPDMGARIPYCESKNKFPIAPTDCDNCQQYHSKYHATKADKIRSMNDEELAVWHKQFSCPIGMNQNDGMCRLDATYDIPEPDKCKDCWLDWLKQDETP